MSVQTTCSFSVTSVFPIWFWCWKRRSYTEKCDSITLAHSALATDKGVFPPWLAAERPAPACKQYKSTHENANVRHRRHGTQNACPDTESIVHRKYATQKCMAHKWLSELSVAEIDIQDSYRQALMKYRNKYLEFCTGAHGAGHSLGLDFACRDCVLDACITGAFILHPQPAAALELRILCCVR